MNNNKSIMHPWRDAEDVLTSCGTWHAVLATSENCKEVSFSTENYKDYVFFVFGKKDGDDVVVARHKPQGWAFQKWSPIVVCQKQDLYSADGMQKLGQFGISPPHICEAQKLFQENNIHEIGQKNKRSEPSMQMAAEQGPQPQQQ